MKYQAISLCCCLLLLGACKKAPEHASFSPDGTMWMRAQEVPAQADKDQLLPTNQLLLEGRWRLAPLVLIEDVENLCGVQATWADAEHLRLRAPAALASRVRVKDGQAWGAVSVEVVLHQDALLMHRCSDDGQRCLAVISDCPQTRWGLYLRRSGEPLFNAAMEEGWNDPDYFGGFGWEQPVASLEWTGPRKARVLVHGARFGVTVRDHIGDVQLQWAFTGKDAPKKTSRGMPLPLLKVIPAATRP